jgi:hypothetical protein
MAGYQSIMPFSLSPYRSTLNCRRRRPTGWCVRVSYVLRSIRHVHWDSTAVPATYKQEEEEEGNNNNNSARSRYKIKNLGPRTASRGIVTAVENRRDECSCCSISESTSTCHQYTGIFILLSTRLHSLFLSIRDIEYIYVPTMWARIDGTFLIS